LWNFKAKASQLKIYMTHHEEAIPGSRKAKSHSTYKKLSLKIDMTPMVDLGFLLITFFIYTTTISSPAVTELYMPIDKPVNTSTNIGESNVLTALLDDTNRIFYYEGSWESAKRENKIFETDYSVKTGLGNIIRRKQKVLENNENFPEGKEGLMLLIKPSSKAIYRNVIDMLDEALINELKKYTIIEPNPEEKMFLKSRSGQ